MTRIILGKDLIPGDVVKWASQDRGIVDIAPSSMIGESRWVLTYLVRGRVKRDLIRPGDEYILTYGREWIEVPL